MRTLSSDTSPIVEALHIELLRNAGDSKRARLCRSLTATVVNVSRRALRDQMPGADENTVLNRWVALNYGDVLAACVARRIEQGR